MSDLVTRLRNWREVHLARLHLLMEEAADQIAILKSKLSLRDNLEQGLTDGVARLQAEVERLRNGALEASETVSQNGDCPGRDNAANADNTPATHATPSEGREQSGCTITDVERAAIERAVRDEDVFGHVYTADVLRGLLERLGGER